VVDIDEPENQINFADGKFDFAFALNDLSPSSDDENNLGNAAFALPPQFGEFGVLHVEKKADSTYDLIEMEGAARKCTTENNFELIKSQPKSTGI